MNIHSLMSGSCSELLLKVEPLLELNDGLNIPRLLAWFFQGACPQVFHSLLFAEIDEVACLLRNNTIQE